MSIASAKQTPRNSYTATSGQTSFNIGFEFFAIADVKVYRNGTLLTYNASPSSVSQYSITGTADATDSANEFGSGGSITLGAGATAGDIIVIIRDLVIERSTDFVPNATFNVTDLNSQLDQILAMIADLDQQSQRSVKLLDTDTIAATVTLPAKATRASKVATFDSDGNLETTIAAVDVTTVAGIATDISTVAGISSNVTSVASNISNVNTVAGIAANITTVAGISGNVTTVAGIEANVTTVAGIQANVTTVAGISSDVSAVAGISSNVTTVAGAVTNINTVAGSIANVNEVANNMGSVNDFAARYRVGSSDPSDSLDEGDLFYNTTDNALKFYNGSAWASITAGIGNVVEDTTPQLGGNLDLNSNDITGTGNLNFTGSITLTGNVDGRDVSTDGTKLDTIATSATANPNAIDNVVEDTTPQLGGTLDANGNAIDMNGLADGLILDTDGDTTISAPTDDQIDIEIGGADDFRFTANKFTALSGSDIEIASGATITNNGTATGFGTPLRPNVKPLIINGNMAVAQRGTSQTGQTANHFPVDRFGFQMDTFGTWTSSQSTDVPTGQGFATSLKLDCTTADTSLDAGHFGVIHYKFEGQDVQLLKKGTSSAEKVTLSFWVKSNKTGNYVIELFDADNSRQISQLYSISSANTWEQKIVTFAGDTSGALDNDNGNSFVIHWALGAGSTYSGGTLNTSWAANNNANRWVGGPNLADSTSNEWYLTGVQLEVGEYDSTTLPPFQHETYIENVERCWRYYEELSGISGTGLIGQGFLSDGSSRAATLIQFHSKRATPTITSSAAGTFTGSQGVVNGGAATGFILKSWNNTTAANSGVEAGAGHVHLDTSGHSGLTDGQICRMAQTSGTTAFMKADAEL